MASLAPYSRIVIKIGSALLADRNSGEINKDWLLCIANEVHSLLEQDVQVLIVSSGAIALGRKRLNLNQKQLTLAYKQACAATGQALLTQAYEYALGPLGHVTAQALLTLNDTEDRQHYINARDTLTTLLSLNAIPIINENDTVATDEICYGDNDRLAARVAEMVSADLLILLSDVDGLYNDDPHQNSQAQHVPIVEKISNEILAMGGGANVLRGTGTGGMATKLQAANIAAYAGCEVIICKGNTPKPIFGVLSGTNRATRFLPQTTHKDAKKRWLANSLKPKGTIYVDKGVRAALINGKSLLVAGVTDAFGSFHKGDLVEIITPDGIALAHGLASYSAYETQQILGLQSCDIATILDNNNGPVLVHRDNMALLI